MKQSDNLKLYKVDILEAGIKITLKQQDHYLFIEDNNISRIKLKDYVEKASQTPISTYQVSAILGIFEGKHTKYLLLCDDCVKVAQIQDQSIYNITHVQALPFNKKVKQDDKIISNITKFLEYGFYFSNKDISLSLQRQHMDQVNNNFIWNYVLLNSLIEQNVTPIWFSTIIQGFVGKIDSLKNQFTYILISRRSKQQSGPRFYHRGIDDDGNVANFVETEQILVHHNIIQSHVIYRGSVPAFWSQRGIGHKAKLTRNVEMIGPAFLKHFQQFKKTYSFVHAINLMGQKKKEQILNEMFEKLIDQNKMNWLIYQQFDIHSVCKNNRYDKMNSILLSLKNNDSFLRCDNQVDQIQNLIYRINCLDCLDRTNLFQSKLCFFILQDFYKKIKIEPLPIELFDDNKQNEFVQQYQNLWADNGDAISQIYCGSDATTSGITRSGKNNIQGIFQHGLATMERLYQSTIADSSKYLVIQQLLLGIKEPKTELELYMQQQYAQYCDLIQQDVYIVTWNVGSIWPDQNNIKQLFDFQPQKIPSLIIIGLQEIVELKAKQVIVSNSEKVQMWDNCIQNNLKQYGNYALLEQTNLMGLFLAVYASKDIINLITKVSKDIVKTGFQGHIGNKGGCTIRFKMLDSELTFTNVHLAAGQKYTVNRLSDIKEIHERAYQNGDQKESKIIDSDYSFFFGDTNFRLEMNYEDAIKHINEYTKAQDAKQKSLIIDKLLDHDQLLRERQSDPILREYVESVINFLPSYKFDFNTDIYDTSKKQRTPSYCDRILVKSMGQLKQLSYKRLPLKDSDHKPICGLYTIEIKKIDKEKMAVVQAQFKEDPTQVEAPVKKKNYFQRIGSNFLQKFQ